MNIRARVDIASERPCVYRSIRVLGPIRGQSKCINSSSLFVYLGFMCVHIHVLMGNSRSDNGESERVGMCGA